ncbi:unnamed protein product [Coffea canephora]|uniref:Uncharacterized protein n=1 Tax=Coffea canephora TaxID=49390 RepID=A0A068URM8_COFCA|nr:unnamed protein product [Coffea canephora]
MAGNPGINNQSGRFQAPPPRGQQAMTAAGVATPIMGQPTAEAGAGAGAGASQASPKIPSPQHSSEVLHQTRKLPYCPARMAMAGFACVATLAYFTLFSHKKPEATALDVARVTTGTATPENTRPRT